MLEFLKRQYRALLDERAGLQTDIEAVYTAAKAEQRDKLNDTEDALYQELRGKITAKDAEIDQAKARLDEAVTAEERARKVAEDRARDAGNGDPAPVTPGGPIVKEPDIYQRDGRNGNSYFRDLARRVLSGDTDATDRLQRHTQHVRQEQRALGNTDAVGGSGGEFAPPAWLVGDWVNLIRAGRITANLFRHETVPPGVSSINYPKISTGTTTALQTTQNTALSQTDLATTYVQTGFATIGGKQVSSQQLLDQTAINFDQVILNDLASDYGLRVGTQVYTGTGTGTGTTAVVNGLSAATAGSSVTWTQATPTAAGFYGQAGKLLAAFLAARLLPPTCWVMAPRRWYWLASTTDGNGRPLVVPNGQAFNTMAVESDPASPMGMVGTFHGLPVYIDPLVPTNISSTQDPVYLLRTDDLVLFESSPQTEVFRETYADSLGVLFRMYGYVGTVLNRHTESIGRILGTGLTTPTFAS